VRNVGDVGFTAGLTEKIGLAVSYQNQIYDYEQDSGPNNRSAMLDGWSTWEAGRSVQVVAGNPGVVGYKYGIVEHTHEKAIFVPESLLPVSNDVRDINSHYLFAGVEHSFNRSCSSMRGLAP